MPSRSGRTITRGADRSRPARARAFRPHTTATAHAGCVAAVRGAVPVPANTPDHIRDSTARLLRALLERNRLEPARIVSAIFTVTEDLDADFPAHAARRLGWTDVPLLNAREIPVPGAMPRVVRVLLTVSGVETGARLEPVYLDGAGALRPDLTLAQARARYRASTGAPHADERRVAIVGLGQIGGSIGLALGRSGHRWRRVGFDAAQATVRRALAAGAIDEAAESIEEACARADLAVIAVPVDAIPQVIEAAAGSLPRGATLLDTGSARGPVTPALARARARGVRAVGGHPIAGNEGHGFPAASATLFERAPFALLPVRGGVPPVARDLVRDLGARPIRVSPGDHDRSLARTSHLPYVIACALAELGGGAAARGLAGPGFRGMTRLAGSDGRVAEAFCRANAREIAQAWRALRRDLDRRVRALGTTALERRRAPRRRRRPA